MKRVREESRERMAMARAAWEKLDRWYFVVGLPLILTNDSNVIISLDRCFPLD